MAARRRKRAIESAESGCRRRPGPGAAGPAGPAVAGALAAADGLAASGQARQADGERAAGPGPVARRLDACRRASPPAGAPASGRCRARPAARSSERSPWVNRSKTCGRSSGVDADAVVARRAITTLVRLDRAAVSRMRPPCARVLGRVVEQVGDHLREPRADRRRPAPASAGSVHRRARCPRRLDERPRRLDRPVRRPSRERRPLARCSAILPRVMRETSSRSSTSRVRWPTWRSMTPATRPRAPVVAGAAQRSRCERVADRRERVAQLVGEHREELVLAPVGVLQRALRVAPLGDVAEDQHDAHDAAAPSRIGAALSSMASSRPSLATSTVWLARPTMSPEAEHRAHRVLDRLARVSWTMWKTVSRRPAAPRRSSR